ncbi:MULTISPECIES: LuxR C-terminal-related transcriptional regulator [Rhodococcus]|uniref:LuxR C-terminal-related transcriptional regulator n=1 Tax=Rhodococcus TaxID=1827 RepID=UPI000C7D511B|nr:LuxR C-terminal-related transcriptional regulator [Rhodococcus ruber]AUM19803.1 helix-turn-helix transcriptional regulator [Rhodococcus ruber]MBD8052153.1 GAF domain-containing protein [Rhodococcus ruber]MCF8786058.1 LuxR C-terminal-related transcriptional regulator [Rhodococcus ruber]
MVSRTATSTHLVERAAELLGTAGKLLGEETRDLLSSALPVSLATTRRRLARALTEGRVAGTDIEDACRILVDIEHLEEQFAEAEAIRPVAELREVHDAADKLRELPPHEIIESAPEVVCTTLPFARSLISAVSGTRWQPRRLYLRPELDGSPLDFSDYVNSAELSLVEAPLETELVRRRVPALVAAPADDNRTHKEMVSASRTSAYVAAPVMSGGKVIGLLHADRPGSTDALDPGDRDRLDTFATILAIIYEQAVLKHRLQLQRARVEKSFDATQTMLDRISMAEAILSRRSEVPADGAVGKPDDHHGVAPDSVLTLREREILSHLATGATNSQIARALVISEGTVKSHVKAVLQKLHAPTRAAAAALYSSRARPQR